MIDTEKKLASFLPHVQSAKWVAVDTEADSLHAYPEKLCLMQISIAGADELVDPLSGIDLTPLLETLHGHELIMHGADYDLRLLRKTFHFVPPSIFDTMLAARLLGIREFGYNSLVQRFLSVALEKGPQKANWAKRPLTERMATYARNDTHYLKPLSDILRAQLQDKGRLSWHQESCTRLIADCAQLRSADPEAVWRVKGSHHLNPAALAVLREVWRWREHEAIVANKPPYFIFPPERMVQLASAAVNHQHWQDMLPPRLSPRRRDLLVKAVTKGLAVEKHPGIIRTRGHHQSEDEKHRMRELERKRDRRAAELGIDATLIASRAVLVLLAKDWDTHHKELMQWQLQLLHH